MNEFQKIIKYIAIAFGIFLCVTIISTIIMSLTLVFGILTGFDDTYNVEKTNISTFKDEYEDVRELRIDINVSILNIIDSNKFMVEAKSTKNEFVSECKDGVLTIKNKYTNKFGIFNKFENTSEIDLYIPKGIQLDKVTIDGKMGDINIESLKTDSLKMDIGVGKVTIEQITANYSKIDAGAGITTIKNADLSDLDLDTGVGKFSISGNIRGNSRISCGVGQTDISLIGEENYQIKTESGIGHIRIGNEIVKDDETYGNGINKIRLEAGVGSVTVRFKE